MRSRTFLLWWQVHKCGRELQIDRRTFCHRRTLPAGFFQPLLAVRFTFSWADPYRKNLIFWQKVVCISFIITCLFFITVHKLVAVNSRNKVVGSILSSQFFESLHDSSHQPFIHCSCRFSREYSFLSLHVILKCKVSICVLIWNHFLTIDAQSVCVCNLIVHTIERDNYKLRFQLLNGF